VATFGAYVSDGLSPGRGPDFGVAPAAIGSHPMEQSLRGILTEVNRQLEDPTVSRRPKLEKVRAEVIDLLKRFEDANFDRQKLYFRVAVLLVLVEQAGLIK